MPQVQVIYGLHAVTAAIRYEPQRVIELWVDSVRKDGRILNITQLAHTAGVSVQTVTKKALNRLTHDARHQGVAAKYQPPKSLTEDDLRSRVESLECPFLLILDGIQDPHNLGACLRSADAAGVEAIVIPKDRSVGMTPTVRKVACGAADTVPVYTVTNLSQTVKWMQQQGIWVYGMDAAGEKMYTQVDYTGPLALVLGAEGAGLRRLIRETVDQLIKIPMHGSVASLNLSVATSIGLFEVQRQRILSNIRE